MSSSATVAQARTMLFVPGHRGERFAKAVAAGSDGVLLDLNLAMVADHGCPVMVPKADDPAHLRGIRDRLPPDTPIVPLIETALGVRRAGEICAVPGVVRPAFGSVDLASELGVAHDDHLALATAGGGAAVSVDGQMVDKPVLDRAHRLLRRVP